MSTVSDALDGEEHLLASLARGDPEAVAAVYVHYGPRMVGFARRHVGDPETAEDVVAQLFERWLQNPPSVRDRERLRAFLATSVYHAAIDWIRQDRAARARPPRSADVAPPPDRRRKQAFLESGPDVSRERLRARLLAALDQLSSSDRLLLETYYGQALSPDECMRLLRIGRDAFHQRLHRARTRLARLLAGERGVTPRGEP